MDINHMMNPRDNIINGLKEFIIKAKTVKNYNTIIETMFESHFKLDDKNELLKNLNEHLVEVFHIHPFALLGYLQFNETLSVSDLEIDNSYKQCIESINKIKMKYGFVIRKLIMKSQAPFIINSVETNIGLGNSLHNITFYRCDGSYLSGMFNPEGLLAMSTSLLAAVKASMERGVYNLNEDTINNYITQSDLLKNYINNLIKGTKQQIDSEVATSKSEE